MNRIAKIFKKKFFKDRSDKEEKSQKYHSGSSGFDNIKRKKALKLKEKLIHKFEGRDIPKATESSVVENRFGELYVKKTVEKSTIKLDQIDKSHILNDLQLIYGIGPKKERRLKREGYNSILDLLEHERWEQQAELFLDIYNESNPEKLQRTLMHWKPASHPLNMALTGYYDPEDFAILDIETMGLTQQPIILFGIGLPFDERVELSQLIVKNISNEPAALLEFENYLKDREVIITYNGKRFDVPYIERRFNFYGMNKKIEHLHFDLYQFVNKLWKKSLPNCKLETVERTKLGLDRDLDIPSKMVPEFYQSYLHHNNPGPLMPILEHNEQDILSLLKIFELLSEDCLDCG